MSNCERLKWNRKKLGLSQKDFAELVGLSVGTIGRLETDETTWDSMHSDTYDKISDAFSGKDFWPIKNYLAMGQPKEVEEQIIVEEEKVVEPTWAEKVVYMMNNGLNEQDKKTMTLVEFAVEGLKEAETHDEFEANINLLKRILKKY